MRSRFRLALIQLLVMAFTVMAPLHADAQTSQSRIVEVQADRTDLTYEWLCVALEGSIYGCPPLSEVSSSDSDSSSAPDFDPWSESVAANVSPVFASASQTSSINAESIEGSGTQASDADCAIVENIPVFDVFRAPTTARSRFDVEFEVTQPTTYSLSGEVTLSGVSYWETSASTFVRLSSIGGSVISETIVSVSDLCAMQPCVVTEDVRGYGVLAPGSYRIEAEAIGNAGCLDNGFNAGDFAGDFDFHLVFIPDDEVPLLGGVGLGILVTAVLCAGVYGSRNRKQEGSTKVTRYQP